jgi:hypothetical protein
MKAQGREHGEWGFKKPTDGWHLVEMGEGIDVLKDKEGLIAKDAKGNNLWKFPAKINDETAEDHGINVDIIVSENTAFGEQKVADILAAIGEFENFEKHFPGDHSVFETALMDKIKIKVPNKFLKLKTETSKDGKYSNVIEIASTKFVPKDSQAPAAGKAAAGKGKTKEAAPSVATGDGWGD